MTGNPPTAPLKDKALLVTALFSALQITPAQHDQIGQILSRIQPVPVPAPASARARSSTAPANAMESSGEAVARLWAASQAAPHPAPPTHSPTPPDLPPLIHNPNPPRIQMPVAPPPSPTVPVPTAPLSPPNPPYGPLPMNAVVVPKGYDYHIPHPTRRGLFYMVVRGLDISIFAGWDDAAALVIGVSGCVYCKVPNVHVGCTRLDAALVGHGAAWLP